MAATSKRQKKKSDSLPTATASSTYILWDIALGANKVVGIIAMMVCAYKWSAYLATLHENHFWFSEIKEVEREISFRTESGLYYSYFKHLVSASTLSEGVDQLKRDNQTEHMRTINIFYRFNIHQELFIAAAYSVYDFGLKPIFFYIQCVFALQGFFLAALFATAWALTGTWVAGVLTSGLMVAHRSLITRVEFTVPLREHFSLPFIFAQFAVIGEYMNAKTRAQETLYLVTIFALTFLLTITWQFAQFVLFLQALVIFGLSLIGILDKDKACNVMSAVLVAIICVWYCLFYQPMILNSLVCSFIPIGIVVLQSKTDKLHRNGICPNLLTTAAKALATLASAIVINSLIKLASGQEADSHIFRFVQSKFGFEDETDFETRLYLCLSIFQPLQWDFFHGFSLNGALPAYAAAIAIHLFSIVMSVFRRWGHKEKSDKDESDDGGGDWLRALTGGLADYLRGAHLRPGLAFHIGQSLILCLLAMTTLRMKCFWGPYICVFASYFVLHKEFWEGIAAKLTANGEKSNGLANFLRHIVVLFAILSLYNANKSAVYEELEDLREFYDPDTVELMEWINRDTASEAAFAGSMQLLAGVRLSTFRPLTNHPHFEDKELRARTKELYQIYAKKPASEVHEILVRYNTSYIILEDSICLAPTNRCNLGSTMDLANGHIPDDGIRKPSNLIQSRDPRFCLEIRHGTPEYARFFVKVFENKTFRIFKVRPVSETKS